MHFNNFIVLMGRCPIRISEEISKLYLRIFVVEKRRAPPRIIEAGFLLFSYAPTHDAAPRAVRMAVATDAMICTMNFSVSFLLIVCVI